MIRHIALTATLLCGLATSAWAQEPTPDLADLSLEELMNNRVTSVAKKAQKLTEAAAAVYVLTGDDIRRAGATNIAEALRMVPGLHVARIDANKWAISSRGFAYRFCNKLLVLIDGRSVYTPLYGGVYWEARDVLIEDIDRIEVIRGPGGTLWGANAVNGVINIVTKHAKDTQGGLLTTGAGTEETLFGHLRYGGPLGENAFYRISVKYFDRDSSVYASGDDAADDWSIPRAGFRIDWDLTPDDTLTVQGDFYEGHAGQTIALPDLSPPYSRTIDDDINVGGGNLIARWQRTYTDDSDLMLQLYYDRTERETEGLTEDRDTFDLEFQHRLPLGERHDLLWGLGYRCTADSMGNSFVYAFEPPERTDHLFSAFIQDEITLRPEELLLTLGSKFEHNDYTGFEIQPNARLTWMPSPRRTLWGAVSRAVRTPARTDEDVAAKILGTVPGVFPCIAGNKDVESDDLLAFELGYRVQPTDRIALDAAAFYNIHDNILTFEPSLPYLETSPAPHTVVPLLTKNNLEGETYGVELAADGKPRDWWRLRAGYTFLQMELHTKSGSLATTAESPENESPQNQLFIHSSMDLPRNLQLDLGARYVDSLPGLNVESYIELDARLAWKPKGNLELFLVGQNLIHNQHAEFGSKTIQTQQTQIERGLYAGVTWRF